MMNKYKLKPIFCLACGKRFMLNRTRSINIKRKINGGGFRYYHAGYSCDNDECEREARSKFLEVK